MPKEKTKKKQSRMDSPAISQRYIKVTVFADEFQDVGVDQSMTIREAVQSVRDTLELKPDRIKAGGAGNKGKIRNALKGASEEQMQKIAELLDIE